MLIPTIKSLQPFAIALSFLLLYIFEYFLPQRKELADWRHDIQNILLGVLNFGIAFGAGYYFQVLLAMVNKHQWGLFPLITINGLLLLSIQLICIDIFMYWWHRFNHVFPALWFFHRFHHADTKMNTTTSFRFHAGELILSYFFKMIVFGLLGISVLAVILYNLVYVPVVIFHHSNISISERRDNFLRYFLVTPRMHRIHHSCIKAETDSNYSSLFPWWDIIFKSGRKKPLEENITFGL